MQKDRRGWDVICAKASSGVQSRSVNIPIVPISKFPFVPGDGDALVVDDGWESDGKTTDSEC